MLKVVILVELVPFNPMMLTSLLNHARPIVFPPVYLANKMPIYDIVENLANGESVQENQRKEVAVAVKPMAINRKPSMDEIQNFVFFHTQSIILMVEVMRFELTLYEF